MILLGREGKRKSPFCFKGNQLPRQWFDSGGWAEAVGHTQGKKKSVTLQVARFVKLFPELESGPSAPEMILLQKGEKNV